MAAQYMAAAQQAQQAAYAAALAQMSAAQQVPSAGLSGFPAAAASPAVTALPSAAVAAPSLGGLPSYMPPGGLSGGPTASSGPLDLGQASAEDPQTHTESLAPAAAAAPPRVCLPDRCISCRPQLSMPQKAVFDGAGALDLKSRMPPVPAGLLGALPGDERHKLETAIKEAGDADRGLQQGELDFTNAKRRAEYFQTALRELLLFRGRMQAGAGPAYLASHLTSSRRCRSSIPPSPQTQLLDMQERAAKANNEANQAEKSYEEGWKASEGIRQQMSKTVSRALAPT